MAQNKREHEYNGEHPRRPAYFPDVTLGNILAIAVFLATGAGVYAANESRVTSIETTQAERDKSVSQQIDDLKQANEKLDGKIERLDDKLDELKTLILQSRTMRRSQ